ncbi:MAG: thiamine phosphate synthase [Verrucomicrobia bacterium]|nr:thiamine phosphate synthase [Verrucomicrobiota bacterium]MDA1203553.1 thiamine phosphate synthase [Verrucomicrobiota bacterium]
MSALGAARLYGIVDLGYLSADTAPVAAEKLLEGGVEILQIRAKQTDKAMVAALAEEIHALTAPLGVPLILNDYPDLLREVPAEGAHLGQDDMTVAEARAAAGRPVIIGKSTHSIVQARAAAEEGADYLGFGPLFATPTKPGREAIGLQDIAAVHELVAIPIFCIGGIKLANLEQVRDAGARRVVIVSGWLQADDIVSAVRSARQILSEAQRRPMTAATR